jgi:hypothetical protein
MRETASRGSKVTRRGGRLALALALALRRDDVVVVGGLGRIGTADPPGHQGRVFERERDWGRSKGGMERWRRDGV